MDRRAFFVGVVCGVTGFATVAAAIVTVIQAEIVAGILGVASGGMAALLAVLVVTLQYDRLWPRQRWLAEGAAGLGYALAGLAAVTYVDVPIVGSLRVTVVVAIALLVGVAMGVLAWRRDRPAVDR
jgi:hypothetical protein